ncbi:MAG: pseudaminic acid synthase [Thermodesulfovibrionales bacterium]
MTSIEVSTRKIGNNHPVFIIAELSANHRQKYELAVETIKAMKESGADAVKLQTYTPDTITIDSDNDYFQIKQGTLWDGKTLYQLYQEAYTPWEWQPKLKEIAEDLGLICFSSPFDKTAVDFLEKMDVPAYKVASFEITDIPLIEYIASKGKPVIISTGIAELSDIAMAVDACKRMGNEQIALLKCTSAYPAPLEDVNLKTIPDLAETFKTVVGLSDHTLGISVPVAAVALNARIIEKHFILDRKLGGPDSAFSLGPEEFKAMVTAVREVEKALGKVSYDLTDKIKKSREFSRSLFVVNDIKAGEVFTEINVRSIRPGFGLHPRYLKDILGKKATKDIGRGTPLSWDMVE